MIVLACILGLVAVYIGYSKNRDVKYKLLLEPIWQLNNTREQVWHEWNKLNILSKARDLEHGEYKHMTSLETELDNLDKRLDSAVSELTKSGIPADRAMLYIKTRSLK